jgi:hypothetical protein
MIPGRRFDIIFWSIFAFFVTAEVLCVFGFFERWP